MRLIAIIEGPAVIQRILARLRLPGSREGPLDPSAMSAAPVEQPTLPAGTL